MKAWKWGAVIGVGYVALAEAIGQSGATMAEHVGLVVGGALGGALLALLGVKLNRMRTGR